MKIALHQVFSSMSPRAAYALEARDYSTPLPKLSQPEALDAVRFGASRKADFARRIVIIGGGLAGVTAAYQAQKAGYDVVLLEEKNRLGGNAKTGYTYSKNGKKMLFPVGASVLAVANDKQRALFQELGINTFDPQYKIHNDIAYFDGQWVSINPDEEPLDPVVKNDAPWAQEFVNGVNQFINFLRNILRTRDGKTHFPIRQAPDEMFKWDKLDLATVLDAWPEKVKQFFTTNLRSDISEDMHRISGLAGIIDQGADMGERILLPGGNYDLIRRMLKRIDERNKTTCNMVEVQKEVSSVRIEEGKQAATISYVDASGQRQRITAKNVLLAIPSHRQPDVVALPAKSAHLLRSINRGSYALMNVFLDKSPVQSNTYYKFPYAKWVADVVQNNELNDPDLPAGSDVPSVLTCYIGITSDMKPDIPSMKKLTQAVLDEMAVAWPWVKNEVRGTRITFYPEAMSAPAPGQMEALRKMNPQLTSHVRSIHSDLSGVFAARGAIDEAMNGVAAIQKADAKHSKTKKTH